MEIRIEVDSHLNRPQTIIEKKFPIIHSAIVVKRSNRGPTNMNMPLTHLVRTFRRVCLLIRTHASAEAPLAPPHPMSTIEKLSVEITNLA
jgi:hypothetical protein